MKKPSAAQRAVFGGGDSDTDGYPFKCKMEGSPCERWCGGNPCLVDLQPNTPKNQSAAQKAAHYFDQRFLHNKSTLKQNEGADLATALLREDRQRRQMERAILAWDDAGIVPKYSDRLVHDALKKIARRLRKERHEEA